jgi:hypothetical protein
MRWLKRERLLRNRSVARKKNVAYLLRKRLDDKKKRKQLVKLRKLQMPKRNLLKRRKIKLLENKPKKNECRKR